MNPIYFDNAATTPVFEEVKKIFLSDLFANPSSIHSAGVASMVEVEKAREIIAKSVKAKAEQVYFTGSGTESNNWVLNSFVSEKKSVVISKIEHPSIIEKAKNLEEKGYAVKYIKVLKNGRIDLDDARQKILESDGLCSVMHVNNETGVIQPIEEISEICLQKKVLFHVDACQSYTKIPINFQNLNIDFITINSSKIHGPKGVGALIVKNESSLRPFIYGGSQENGLRAGTLNLNSILAFSKAVELNINLKVSDKIKKLQQYLINEMRKHFSDVMINGDVDYLAPHILNIRLREIKAKDVFWYLNKNKIYTSMSSACSSNKFTPSYVLESMGLNQEENFSSIRISLGYFNTEEEINIFVKMLGLFINDK